jgi:GNAT superfamily N-acetyltransferase
MTTLNIRRALPTDVPEIHQLIVDLAVYEKEPDAVVAHENDIHEALFCDSPRTFGLVCEQKKPGESAPLTIGFAIYFYNFSTWLGKHGIYLEDLYVTPEARGQGAGKALLKTVARIARDEGLGRFEWSVLKWNTPSIEFYEACGAAPLDEWVGYRMDRAAIEAFCADDG